MSQYITRDLSQAPQVSTPTTDSPRASDDAGAASTLQGPLTEVQLQWALDAYIQALDDNYPDVAERVREIAAGDQELDRQIARFHERQNQESGLL